MNLYNLVLKYVKISVDSANFNFIKKFNFNALTSNPSLILESVINNHYNIFLKNYFLNIKKKKIDSDNEISIYDEILILIAGILLPYVKDNISIEIPARISFNYNKIIFYSIKLIKLIEKYGLNKNKILIKIPATNCGIKAAEKLKFFGIKSNLTLIFDIEQVKKCFDAGIYLISPFVGRISDLIKCDFDSGVNFVKNISNYKKINKYNTLIMGASFRNINQIINLICCDYITVPPVFIEKMNKISKTYFEKINTYFINYSQNHINKISNLLLLNGIKQFNKDHNNLIKILSFIIKNL